MIQFLNYGQSRFQGWIRSTTRTEEGQHSGCWPNGQKLIFGPLLGDGSFRIIDLFLDLEAGQKVEIDNRGDGGFPEPFFPRLPMQALSDPAGFFGVPKLGGMILDLQTLPQEGAAFVATFANWVTPGLHATLHLPYFPGQPWTLGELLITAGHSQLGQTAIPIPTELTLTMGDALVQIPGLLPGYPVLPAGEWLAAGQSRAFPVSVVWTHQDSSYDWETAAPGIQRQVLGEGDHWKAFGLLGLPGKPGRAFDPISWFSRHHAQGIDRLHSWVRHDLGISATAGDTGEQEDQGFVKGSECFHPYGVGAHYPRYLAALGQARRPCLLREPDGRLLDPFGHPRLVMWLGTWPHWNGGVSPDRLGLPREPTGGETHNWSGPDRQHWLVNTLAASYQLTGSKVLQTLLEAHARIFWFRETVDHRLSTSGPDAARSAGWAGMVASWLWKTLEDRPMAIRIRDRFKQRVEIYRRVWHHPEWKVGHWEYSSDPRILSEIRGGYQWGWMPYQQAIGAGGLEMAGQVLDIPEARQLALHGALAVVDYAYTQDPNGRWIEWDMLGVATPGEPIPKEHYVERQGAHRTGWYAAKWMPFAVWTVLQHIPDHPRAVQIYNQISDLVADSNVTNDWLPPI